MSICSGETRSVFEVGSEQILNVIGGDKLNMTNKGRKRHLSSAQIIMFGFAAAILLGALILMLPISTRSGEVASFRDTLFTATSATCVTGLIVQDTATYWSEFGQFVIILLIQIGGMGIVTIALAIAMASGKKIGLMQVSTMQDAVSAHNVGSIASLTKIIVKGTFLIEFIGAALMAPTFCNQYGLGKGLWYAVFHSISAFCNAGFDLMGVEEKFSSLTAYSDNVIINVTIMLLIVVGGIGFLTWEDIATHKLKFKKYKMQSKVILTVTLVVIVVPAIIFYFFEFKDFEGISQTEKILMSFFQSVTPRTAGFNTVNFGLMSEAGIAILIILMLIGGSSGSTAGGMKTTTVAVLLSAARSAFCRKEDTHLFKRRIPADIIKNAATIMVMYLTLSFGAALIMSYIEDLPVLTCAFETVSAMATVGLTMGATPELSLVSHIILIALMFCGRVGGMTLVFAAITVNKHNVSKLPQERITVG